MPDAFAAHLLRADHNERVEIHELRGTAAADLTGALADMAALAAGTQCRRPLYHASLNTRVDEPLTDAQRAAAIDRLENALGLAGHPRAVVIHEKAGREHCHVVWAHPDVERARVVPDLHNYRQHKAVAAPRRKTKSGTRKFDGSTPLPKFGTGYNLHALEHTPTLNHLPCSGQRDDKDGSTAVVADEDSSG